MVETRIETRTQRVGRATERVRPTTQRVRPTTQRVDPASEVVERAEQRRCQETDRRPRHRHHRERSYHRWSEPSVRYDTARGSAMAGQSELVDWEADATRWIAWARKPGHDSYWYYRDAFFGDIVPEPRERTLDLACGEGR